MLMFQQKINLKGYISKKLTHTCRDSSSGEENDEKASTK